MASFTRLSFVNSAPFPNPASNPARNPMFMPDSVGPRGVRMVDATPSATPMPAQPVATVTSIEALTPLPAPLPHAVAPSVTDPVSNLDFPSVDDAFALEMRSETIEQLVGGDALRRGVSERIEAGRSEANADRVAGRDRVRVHATLHEHTGHGLAEQATHLHTTVDGVLDVHAASEDTVLLAGHMRELWDGGAAIVAAMTDDTVAGGGIRVTTPLDLWVHGLMGVEERIGTCTADAVLLELGATHYEREYGPGVHAAGLAAYTGSLYHRRHQDGTGVPRHRRNVSSSRRFGRSYASLRVPPGPGAHQWIHIHRGGQADRQIRCARCPVLPGHPGHAATTTEGWTDNVRCVVGDSPTTGESPADDHATPRRLDIHVPPHSIARSVSPAFSEPAGGLVHATDVSGPPPASGLPGPSLSETAGAQAGDLGRGWLDPSATVSGTTAAEPAATEAAVTPSLAGTSSFWLQPADPAPPPPPSAAGRTGAGAGAPPPAAADPWRIRPQGMGSEPHPVAFDPWSAPPGPSSQVGYTRAIRTPVMSTGAPPGWQGAETHGFARAASGAVELPFSRREEIAIRFGTEDALLDAELTVQLGGAGRARLVRQAVARSARRHQRAQRHRPVGLRRRRGLERRRLARD